MNGQAKIDFDNWLIDYYRINRKDYDQFSDDSILKKHYRKTIIEQNALKIEWFDSVGIFILINLNNDGFNYEIGSFDNLIICNDWFETRQQVTEKALEKSVELYNLKFKENE